jgi:hypothetical protein
MSIDGFKYRPRARGWTVMEMMVSVALFGSLTAAVLSVYLFSLTSLTAVSNYASLDKANREATDWLTREIRSARCVTGYTTNPPSLTVLAGDGVTTITYGFDPGNRRMTRAENGAVRTLLTNCTLVEFSLFMRPPTTNSTDVLVPVTPGIANWSQVVKGVQMAWKTSKPLGPGGRLNSENVQTARIVIRKQQN